MDYKIETIHEKLYNILSNFLKTQSNPLLISKENALISRKQYNFNKFETIFFTHFSSVDTDPTNVNTDSNSVATNICSNNDTD